MKFNNVFTKTVQIIFAYLLILLIFQIFRALPLFLFRGDNSLDIDSYELFLAFSTGFKFDTIVITYLFSFLLILLIPYIFISGEKYNSVMNKVFKFSFITISFLILVLVTVDYNYYKFFHSHFDVGAFGIVEDDTLAVLASVWTDYPVIKILIVLTVSFIGIKWFLGKVLQKKYTFFSRNFIVRTAYMLVFLSVFFLGMRGSLDTFPIGKDDMIVCDNNIINDITPNCVFYLKEAIVDRMRYKIDTSLTPILSKYKYHNSVSALAQYTQKSNINETDIEVLESVTDSSMFLEENAPNVVFILMESFGNHYMELHSDNLNLLGELENQLEYCHLYRNFLSGGNGTIGSFEGLAVNSPSVPISLSKYQGIQLKSSCALPFKKDNYNTIYLTGGDLAWMNTGKYISNQYFDEIEGRGEILKYVEGASDYTWGVFDEFLFERIYSKLISNNSEGKKSFIFALTISNHTPFVRPDSYKPFPVNLTEEIKGSIKTTEEIAIDNFTSYQYSNHHLGELIKRIRESELGKNTIIAVTGDHNNRQLFEYSDNQTFFRYSVPFILYVPEEYAAKKVFDTERFGSHKDIFPTLYNLSLSNQTYLKSGNDLSSADTNTYFYGVNAYNMGVDSHGVCFYSSGLTYEWIDGTRELQAAKEKDQFEPLENAVRSYSFSMDYYVRNLIKQSFNKKNRN
jgi:hypothetical protein